MRHFAEVVVFVAARVLDQGAFLADRDVARLAEEAQHLGTVLGAIQRLLDHLHVLFCIMQFSERQHAVTLEAVHELVRHHAVRAQEVGAVEAARDRVRVAALAPGATQIRRAIDGRRLKDVAHGEVR